MLEHVAARRAEEQEMQGEVNTGDRDAEKEERHHIGPEVHDPGGSEVEVATADQSLDSGLMAAPAVEWSEEEPVLEEGAPLVAGAPLTQKARTKKIKAKTKTVKMKRDQQSVQGASSHALLFFGCLCALERQLIQLEVRSYALQCKQDLVQLGTFRRRFGTVSSQVFAAEHALHLDFW